MKALGLWAEKSFRGDVGIVLGLKDGERGWEWCQPFGGMLQAQPGLPYPALCVLFIVQNPWPRCPGIYPTLGNTTT